MIQCAGDSKKKDGAGVRGGQKLGPPRTVNIEYNTQDCDLAYAGVNDFDPRVHFLCRKYFLHEISWQSQNTTHLRNACLSRII
jgi:hypothetical protein